MLAALITLAVLIAILYVVNGYITNDLTAQTKKAVNIIIIVLFILFYLLYYNGYFIHR